MFQFFTSGEVAFGDTVRLTGEDAHHISRVLRLRPGEKIRISTPAGASFICELTDVQGELVLADACGISEDTELEKNIRLFQAIPKGDRFDTIVEKTVELGVKEIIPVRMKYCVARWDEKKAEKKRERYAGVAYAAAKQSKRSALPGIHMPLDFSDAVEYAKSFKGCLLVPYENKDGMEGNAAAYEAVRSSEDISIFIGPEGGFSREEIEMLDGLPSSHIISLGRRILRTDTAAITAVGAVMMEIEKERGASK